MLLKLVQFSLRNLQRRYSKSTESVIAPFFKKMSETNTFKKTRYDGRSKKRQWEQRRSDQGSKQRKLEEERPVILNENGEKIKRRKYAILMGYSGAEYYGMQRNPNTKTIEEDLFKALLKVDLIKEDSFNQVQNMQFQRAARTDKGVSAARQICSMKLYEHIDLEKLNNELPEVIRVFAYKRVTKGFNSKTQCDGRTYIYVLPTAAFQDHKEEMDQKSFRITEEKLKKISEVLELFQGTKNYHNFTSKKKPKDPSSMRFIKSFTYEKPFIKEGVEFMVLRVYGQSFMLHQIRKMVGLLLAIVRGQAPLELMSTVFNHEKVNIPRAPGLGLVLDYVHYERYNHRYGEDGMHDKLTWEEVEDKVLEFKEKFIYPTIINTELKEQPMIEWVREKLSRHAYDEEEEDDKDEEEGSVSDDEGDTVKCDEQDTQERTDDKVVKDNVVS